MNKPNRFRFRAWDGLAGEMIGPFALSELCADQDSEYGDQKFGNALASKLMQSTGMVDKHGVEIFEGDIIFVNHPGMTQRYPCVVKWHEDDGCWVCADSNDGEFFDRLRFAVERKCNILGNIYQNPGLIKEG